MSSDTGKRLGIFVEKCLLWMFEGGKPPFYRNKHGRGAVKSQAEAVNLKGFEDMRLLKKGSRFDPR